MTEYGTENYIRVDSWRPGWVRFMYVDVEGYLADDVFETYGVYPKYANGEYFYPGTPYVLVECRVRTAEAPRFAECMATLERKALFKGYANYPAMCKEILGFAGEEAAMDAYEAASGSTDRLRDVAEDRAHDSSFSPEQVKRIKEAYVVYDEYEFDIWAKGFFSGCVGASGESEDEGEGEGERIREGEEDAARPSNSAASMKAAPSANAPTDL